MTSSVRASAVPAALARVPYGVIRARDAREAYVQPSAELRRLESRGLLRRLTGPYYAIVPASSVGTDWRPSLEASAYGVAAAAFGPDEVALMGVSAARMHGAHPRAVAVGVVALPSQRPQRWLVDRSARIRFVRRLTRRLDVERMPTDLGSALVTGVEQTILDLASPRISEMSERDARDAIRILMRRADAQKLESLADSQRLHAALARARASIGQGRDA